MATRVTAKELRNMQMEELRKEAAAKRLLLSKMHLDVQLGSEKDTARFHREKKDLARLLTVITEKEKTEGNDLKKTEKTATVRPPAKKTVRRSVSTSSKK